MFFTRFFRSIVLYIGTGYTLAELEAIAREQWAERAAAEAGDLDAQICAMVNQHHAETSLPF